MASGSRTTILPQSKEALLKSYNARLKDDVRSMLENFEGKCGSVAPSNRL